MSRRRADGDVKVIINNITAKNAVGDEMDELFVNSYICSRKKSKRRI